MILDATTKKIQCVMAEVITTSNPDYACSYADVTTSTFTPSVSDGALNGVTVVDIISAPASSTQRVIRNICITNKDTVTHNLTFYYNNNGTQRIVFVCQLLTGETVQYTPETAFKVTTRTGTVKTAQIIAGPTTLFNNIIPRASSVATTGGTSGTTTTYLVGNCTKTTSTITVAYKVTNAFSALTYAEFCVFTGRPAFRTATNTSPADGVDVSLLGYADVSGVITSTGIKTTTITLTTAAQPGDMLYLGIGFAGSAGDFLATVTDDVEPGFTYKFASGRPSTKTYITTIPSVTGVDAIAMNVYLN
jgi:hypothetical protein